MGLCKQSCFWQGENDVVTKVCYRHFMKTLMSHTSLENVPFKQSFICACIPLDAVFIGLPYTLWLLMHVKHWQNEFCWYPRVKRKLKCKCKEVTAVSLSGCLDISHTVTDLSLTQWNKSRTKAEDPGSSSSSLSSLYFCSCPPHMLHLPCSPLETWAPAGVDLITAN